MSAEAPLLSKGLDHLHHGTYRPYTEVSMLPPNGSAQQQAEQELAALLPWLARALQGAVVLWRPPQDVEPVAASHLLAVTPELLAFALRVARQEPGVVLVAPDTHVLCGTPVVDSDGTRHGVLCVRFLAEQQGGSSAVREAAVLLARTLQRQQAHAQLQSMLDGLHEGVVLLDQGMHVQRFNRRAAQLLGQPGRGMSDQDFLAFGQQAHGLDGQPIPLDRLPMWTALQTGQPQLNVTLGAPVAKGIQRWVRVNAGPVWPRGVVASFTDVTESVQLRQAMQEALEHDPLTGLPNRSLFEKKLQEALNALSAKGESCTVGFVDLDGFKEVNDLFGHAAGDGLLRQVARRLTQAVRTRDVVARLAGDEFTVLWWGVSDPTQAAELGERLVQACVPSFRLREGEATITCSVGVRVVTTADLSVKTVLRSADLAMYQAKRQGKNRCVVVGLE